MSTTRFFTPAPRPPGLRLSQHESDVPLDDESSVNVCGVFHAASTALNLEPKNFWVTDISLWPLITDWLHREYHYDAFAYTPYSSQQAWETANGGEYPIVQVINGATFIKPRRPSRPSAEPEGLMSPPFVQRRNQASSVTPGPDACRGLFQDESVEPTQQQQPPIFDPTQLPGFNFFQQMMGIGTTPAAPAPAPEQDATMDDASEDDPGIPPTVPAGPQPGGVPPFQFTGAGASTAPPTNLPNDAGTMYLMWMMQQTMQQNQQALLSLVNQQTKVTKPTLTFPKWDGKPESQQQFLERLKTIPSDPAFSGANWTTKAPGMDSQSAWLRNAILQSLPEDELAAFSDQPAFEDDGFAMFTALLHRLQPNTVESRLQNVMDLASLEQGPTETVNAYLARARRLCLNLKGIQVDSLIPLLCLCRLDKDKFAGIHQSLRQADPQLIQSTMKEVEARVLREQFIAKTFGYDEPIGSASARRSDKKPPSAPHRDAAPTVSYPPPKQPFHAIQSYLESHPKNCIGCFGDHPLHLEKGCPPCAKQGWVVKKDATEAAKIWEAFEAASPDKGGNSDKPDATPPADDEKDNNSQASASRVSAARSSNNQFTRTFYQDLESDGSEDEDADGLAGHLEDSDGKNNTSSSSYSPTSKHAFRPTPCNPRSVASARHVPLKLADAAKKALLSPKAKISTIQHGHSECCADSGATEHMLPDYSAFVSYKKCHNESVTLGDETQLPIMGRGKAVFMINGKTIQVRDALHVPGLRAPLYSLRKHRHMDGCGYYSQFGVGSFILFPSFTIEVDDSEDNIVSYKSIGRQLNVKLDYKEPKYPQARPAHLIPDDEDLQHVTFHVPDPKARKLPPVPSTPSVPDPDPDDSIIISDDELTQSATKPLTKRMLAAIHDDVSKIPSVPPAYTPAPAENSTKFDSLHLHRIFGCRKFKNQTHITAASKNAELIRCGEMPSTIGDYTTINNPAKGKPLTKRRKYLNKVHMDIVFGDCVALGGFRYALVIVDVATRFTWVYGLTSLSSSDIIGALLQFRIAAGAMPKEFHSDFDRKLIGGQTLRWIQENHSSIKAAPARRQSSNGLVERTWQTLVRMARAYITEKQVGREFWYFSIKHAAHMLNQVPGRLGRKLTTPFELVYNQKPDARTWFELFSIRYFPVEKKAGEKASATQCHTMDGIAVGRDEKSNTIIFYNPLTKSYYSPPTFKLDPSHLPVMLYPKHIRYDGGFICGPLRNRTDPVPEPFPPGTRVEVTVDGDKCKGTIQNTPSVLRNRGHHCTLFFSCP
jgi:hypothetical protein